MSTSKSAKSFVKLGNIKGFFIRKRQPWVWKLLFPGVPFKNTAFTWGDTIYTDNDLSKDALAHEKTHVRQQKFSKIYGFFCILLYKYSKSYRSKCEIPAHVEQYKVSQDLEGVAASLSSPLYGPLMSFNTAKILLCALSE